MWKQRSQNDWRKRDRNTKYFHCRAKQKNHQNLIVGLEDDNGIWVEDEVGMGRVIETYFGTIFTNSNPLDFDQILNGMH